MQTNATMPVIYAVGTLTTGLSFLVIAGSPAAVAALRARQARRGSAAGKGTLWRKPGRPSRAGRASGLRAA